MGAFLEGAEQLVAELLAQVLFHFPGAAQDLAGSGIQGQHPVRPQVLVLDEGGELARLHEEGDDPGKLAPGIEDGAGQLHPRRPGHAPLDRPADVEAVAAAAGEMDVVVPVPQIDPLAGTAGGIGGGDVAVPVDDGDPGPQLLQGALAQQGDGGVD